MNDQGITINHSFCSYLKYTACKTNNTEWGIFARAVVKGFRYRSFKKMNDENVSEDLKDALYFVHEAYQESRKTKKVDECVPGNGMS